MAIANILKKKKKLSVKKTEKKTETQKTSDKKTKSKKQDINTASKKAEINVLFSPHITEKAVALSAKDQYIFKVPTKSNKIEIKKAIGNKFNVKVINVRIINVKPKAMKFGKTKGWKKGYKKAIVKIKKGQKIDIT